MTRRWVLVVAGAWWAAHSAIVAAESRPGHSPAFVFRDVAEEAGLLPDVAGIRGHAAGWGDADGDGWLDLYVGTFHTEGSKANRFFRNHQGRFRLDPQPALGISTRASAALFADLDNDGDLDLYVASMPAPAGSKLAERAGQPLAPCTLLRNDGQGRFTNVSQGNGACPAAFGGRSAAVLDFDGDGRLDLLVGEDPLPGYNGSPTKSSRLFRNLGDLRFEDVSRDVGLVEGIPGLGVAAGDVNGDGWPDFFLASSGGGNVLFLNDGHGRFQEAPGSRSIFAWPNAVGDDMVCGVVLGDVNRDGLVDVVLGQHFQQPWLEPVANRLYLNRGLSGGDPTFEDVTRQVGLVALPMKSPHVEIQDFDNDGWPDISTSVVKFAGGRPHPVIFRNEGSHGLPRFREEALAVNDFPNDSDRAVRRTGPFFDKMVAERKIIYTAPGPVGDYDNDGRLDMFLANWWLESPSLLLHNETPGGHWLQVQVEGTGTLNRMGIGARIRVHAAGRLEDADGRLGEREIAAGFGYASGQPAIAHFGLGRVDRVDVEVVLPHGRGSFVAKGIQADQRITLRP